MLQTEFLRSLNSNYERILLDKNPEENRYQYCMISRGGIKGLLSCSLRYLNGQAYLYYDITSKQNVVQIYGKKPLPRQWVRDFMWSFRQIKGELSRFLLDERNVLWYPQQIFQDLESNVFSFLYVPYYEADNGFGKLLEFMIEHIDYEDERLVECVYRMYEQFEKEGQDYLGSHIFRDAEMLEEGETTENDTSGQRVVQELGQKIEKAIERKPEHTTEQVMEQNVEQQERNRPQAAEQSLEETVLKRQEYFEEAEKRGIRTFFKNKKKKDKEKRENYQNAMQLAMTGYAVAEEAVYEEEEWGRTIYIEEKPSDREIVHCLYTPEGRMVTQLNQDSLTIGKKKEEVDLVLEDMSISRMHARILKEQGQIYLEDLNSTNGTYKNGLRMEPYEKRKLEVGDEIQLGTKELIFR